MRLAEEHAQLWLMRADGTDQHLLLDDLSKSPTASTQPPLWWGFYGYTNWSQFFDWWQGPRA